MREQENGGDSDGKKMTLLTPEEAAERLRVKVKTVTYWLREGTLRGIKIGHFWRIPEERLAEFLEAGRNDYGTRP